MAWIPCIPDDETEGELKELYDAARDPGTGEVDEILKVHSLHPRGMAAHLELYQAVMRPTPGVSKLEREWVAYVVSGLNGCVY